MPLPKSNVLKNKVNSNNVEREKPTILSVMATSVESLDFTPIKTYGDYVALLLLPKRTTIAIVTGTDNMLEYAVVVGYNKSLTPNADGQERSFVGETIEVCGNPIKKLKGEDYGFSGHDIRLYRESAIICRAPFQVPCSVNAN